MTNEGKPIEAALPLLGTGQGNTYLVTEDLSKIIKTWCEEQGKPFPDPQGPFYEEIMTSLCDAMQKYCFPECGVKVTARPHASFADILERGRSYEASLRNEFWVSLDNVYADVGTKGEDGFDISITRFVDRDNAPSGRGPRPESSFDTIAEQVLACVRCWRYASKDAPRPVVVVDDGSITGGTIIKILEELADHNMYVDSVRLGISNPPAINNIGHWMHTTGHKVRFFGSLKLCPDVFDWATERDFFPGVPRWASRWSHRGRSVDAPQS